MPNFSARFDRESDQLLYLMPTLTGSLRAFGLSPAATRLPQLGLAMLSAVWVWRACREGLGPRALLVLATATFLATPYAFVYDLPLLTGAALLFARERLDARRGLSTGEVAVLTLALVFPAVLVHAGAALPIGVACLLLLAAVLIADPPTKDAARP
jgi:hypothetical protein